MVSTRNVFVGRRAELAVASAALEAARGARPQILWVEGEPGIGKTAFLREFLRTCGESVVLEASGDESETKLEFGIISQLLAREPAAAASPLLRQRLRQGSPMSALSVGSELLEMLGTLQERAPVVVALDDAQWSDQPSAAALQFALRRVYGDRVLVLVVSRSSAEDPERSGPSWARLLNDPERSDRVRLSGLATEEIRTLAASLGLGPFPRAAAERLREHTHGHPLHVRTLLTEIPADVLTYDRGPLPAPRSFAATVLAGVAKLSLGAQDLIAAAAVAGGSCRLDQAGRAGVVRDAPAALQEAREAELLRLVPNRAPVEISLVHPLVRAAVYNDLSPSRRGRLHLAWAQLTPGAGSLAHRVAASLEGDDELAAELVAGARTELEAGAVTGGIDRLLWAWRVAASRSVQEAALLRAVDLLGLAGDVPRAHGLRDAVLACSESLHRSFILATLSASAGRLAEAEAALREVALNPRLTLEPDLHGQVLASLAIVCAYAGRGDDAVGWARMALSGHADRASVAVTATQAQALGLALCGRADEGIATLASLSTLHLRPEPFEAELMATRGRLKTWHGDLQGAVEDLLAVTRWARDGTPLRSLPNAYGSLAEAEYWLGRWDEGLAHADVAVSLAQDADQVWELPFVHAVAALLDAGRADLRAAAEHVAAAGRAAQDAPLPLSVHYAGMAAAHVARVRGDWENVLVMLAPLRAGPAGDVAAGLGQRACGLLAAEALVRTGRLHEARQALDELDRLLAERRQILEAIEACRLRGALEQADGHPGHARAAFVRGRELAAGAGSPPLQAQLELEHGRFLRKLGRRRQAIAALRGARDRFESLGARVEVDRCDGELTACGIRSPGHGIVDDVGLTAREQVVAQMVAAGKSNREVAAELYLSTKAIEYHLANIFTKLDVRSRHQIATRLAAQPTSAPLDDERVRVSAS